MLPKRPARADLDTLTWEYLDGVSSPTRMATLEELLLTRKEAREAFVEHCTLEAMLRDHYKADASSAGSSRHDAAVDAVPRRKRRRGKPNAA